MPTLQDMTPCDCGGWVAAVDEHKRCATCLRWPRCARCDEVDSLGTLPGRLCRDCFIVAGFEEGRDRWYDAYAAIEKARGA